VTDITLFQQEAENLAVGQEFSIRIDPDEYEGVNKLKLKNQDRRDYLSYENYFLSKHGQGLEQTMIQ